MSVIDMISRMIIEFEWFHQIFVISFAVTMKFSNDSLRTLIGPLGALKRKIEEQTGMFRCL